MGFRGRGNGGNYPPAPWTHQRVNEMLRKGALMGETAWGEETRKTNLKRALRLMPQWRDAGVPLGVGHGIAGAANCCQCRGVAPARPARASTRWRSMAR